MLKRSGDCLVSLTDCYCAEANTYCIYLAQSSN